MKEITAILLAAVAATLVVAWCFMGLDDVVNAAANCRDACQTKGYAKSVTVWQDEQWQCGCWGEYVVIGPVETERPMK